MFSVELNDNDIERLIDAGWLDEREELDGEFIASAISDLVESLEGPKNRLGICHRCPLNT